MTGDDAPPHTHCWHTETTVRFVMPAQATVVCCHCGQREARTVRDLDETLHGPYLPTKSVVIHGRPRGD